MEFYQQKTLTLSSTCCDRLHRFDMGTFLVSGCKAKHGVRVSVVSRPVAVVSLCSLNSADVLTLNTCYRLSTPCASWYFRCTPTKSWNHKKQNETRQELARLLWSALIAQWPLHCKPEITRRVNCPNCHLGETENSTPRARFGIRNITNQTKVSYSFKRVAIDLLDISTTRLLIKNACTWQRITECLRKLAGNAMVTLSVIGGRKWRQRRSLDIAAWFQALLTKHTKGAFKAANNSVSRCQKWSECAFFM